MVEPITGLPDPNSWFRPIPNRADPNGPTNRPTVVIDRAVREEPIIERFRSVVARQPDAHCLLSQSRCLTYREVWLAVTALAARIAAHTAPGQGVAILLKDELNVALAQLACLANGRVGLLLNPSHPEQRLAAMLSQAAPSMVVTDDDRRLPEIAGNPYVLRQIESPSVAVDSATSPAAIDTPSLVVYTSGSTGIPKGFVRSQRQITALSDNSVQAFRIDPSDVALSLFSLTNGSGQSCLMPALLTGASMFTPPLARDGLSGILALLRTGTITLLWVLPSVLRTLVRLPDAARVLRSVRGVFLVSEPVSRADLESWRQVLPARCALLLLYSMTEASGIASWFLPHDPPYPGPSLPIGYLTSHYEGAIVGPDGQAVALGEVGTLWLRGRVFTLGEWRNGRCEASRTISDPDDSTRRLLCTNDSVRAGADGRLEFSGRADNMIKIRGNRVEPAEVEDALRRLPMIAEVAILPFAAGEAVGLTAYIVTTEGRSLDRTAIVADLARMLPSYMIPSRFTFLPTLPRLVNGKLDLQQLKRDQTATG